MSVSGWTRVKMKTCDLKGDSLKSPWKTFTCLLIETECTVSLHQPQNGIKFPRTDFSPCLASLADKSRFSLQASIWCQVMSTPGKIYALCRASNGTFHWQNLPFWYMCLRHFLASAEDLDALSIRITPTPTVLFGLLQFWACLHYMSTINHCVSRKRLHTHTITLRKLLALQNQLPLRNACA